MKIRSALMLMTLAAVVLMNACKKPDPPTASFTFSVNGMDVSFTDNSDGEIDSWEWNFGDGSTSTSQNPSHTYSAGGDYTVTLKVTNKGGDNTATQTVTISDNSGPDESNPSFEGADGALYAVNTSTFQEQLGFPIEVKVGTAVGVFFDNAGTAFVNAGNVTVDGNQMDIMPNNSYNWVNLGADFFGNPVDWTVAGGGGIPAFNETVTLGFPTVSKITSSADVSSSSGYTLSVENNITDADSVMFFMNGPDGSINFSYSGGVNSHNFSAADLSAIGTGSGIAQVVAYNFTNTDHGGKNIYFVNESVVSLVININ